MMGLNFAIPFLWLDGRGDFFLAVLKRKRDDSVLTIQYHEFDGLQSGMKRFRLFFTIFHVIKRGKRVRLTQQRSVAEQMRTEKKSSLEEIKKGISGKRPMPCIPPGFATSGKTFPPENVFRPPCRQNPMQTCCGPFILPGNPPDSVTSRARTAYAGGWIAPPSAFTISRGKRGSKLEKRH